MATFKQQLNLTLLFSVPYHRELGHEEVNLKIFDNNSKQLVSLERQTYVKNLGVLIDGSLSLKHHIDYISTNEQRNWRYC